MLNFIECIYFGLGHNNIIQHDWCKWTWFITPFHISLEKFDQMCLENSLSSDSFHWYFTLNRYKAPVKKKLQYSYRNMLWKSSLLKYFLYLFMCFMIIQKQFIILKMSQELWTKDTQIVSCAYRYDFGYIINTQIYLIKGYHLKKFQNLICLHFLGITYISIYKILQWSRYYLRISS